jgi:predicted nucleic acid-binding Zn ribbon protein
VTEPEDPTPPEHLAGLSGMDLVRRALEEARAAARGQGKDVGQGRRAASSRRAVKPGARRRWSGPGPDQRDPQSLGGAARELAKTRGWSPRVAEGTVLQHLVDQTAEKAWTESPNNARP